MFHERWEARAYALNTLGIRILRAYNVHEYRHAVERMDPAHYLAASYYERWFTGVATLLVEKGVVTREELEARAGGRFPLGRPPADVKPLRVTPPPQPRFAAGDSVRVREIHPAGHTRVPRYVRGKHGVVVRASRAFEFPDLAGHALPAHLEHTYHVEFEAGDLWTDAAERRETVVVDLWESYLEAAP
jgi:nitrile hydratase